MDRYAVIGNPVEHSLSPQIHNLFAEHTNQSLSYCKLPAPPDGFAAVVEEFFAAGGQGLNVTLPFKGVAAQWVDERDAAADAAGVVNTIAIESGRRVGYNTDGVGLMTDLCENHRCTVVGRKLLVLGAGGAVKGIIRPLLAALPQSVTFANRSVEKAHALTEELRREGVRTGLDCCALEATRGRYDVVINGTSAGLSGHGALIAEAAVRDAVCYDLVYSTQSGVQTPFCAWASKAGAAHVYDGLGMLVEQAAEAFRIWRGILPPTAPVLALLNGDGSKSQ